MRIKRISEIKNFSIFKNFNWSESLSNYDFKDINILYGRNYSGKTSLSKIIRSLEKKALPPKYDNPNFTIKLQDDSEINQSTLLTFEHPIHVYNSDFVKENLKFIHNEDANIESFSVTLGGDNQQILDKITELEYELGSNKESYQTGIFLEIYNQENSLKDAKKSLNNKQKILDDFLGNKATKSETSIKSQYELFGDINYNIPKLLKDIKSVQKPSFQVLSDTEISDRKALILQKELEHPPLLPTYSSNFLALIQSVEEILKSIVINDQQIQELTNNPTLNSWVQTGHQLHLNRDTCAFCDNTISQQRRIELKRHFDQEFQNLQNRITKGINHLTELLNGENLKIDFDIKYYYQQYHVQLALLKLELSVAIEKQKFSIEQLKTQLEEKNQRPFTELQIVCPQDYSEEIKSTLRKISVIRDECIQLNTELIEKQTQAKEALKLNHVYHFINDINYAQLNKEIDIALKAIPPLEQQLESVKNKKAGILADIKSEKSKLRSEGEACNRIKEILQHDFGHQNLSLEPIETISTNGQSIKFEIQRIKNGVKSKAYNLSEGECSLISFCYFLAKVQEALNNGENPIIWIDDPICSLDSNHIFFIFSLIEEKICKEKKYSQLFISTHNLEFLKYLRRISGVDPDGSIATVQEHKRKAGYYLIQRHDSFSTIRKMPIYLSKFLTEFNFLFEQIYKCATVSNIDDSNFHIFYNFGNNARKFLEIYTFYKFPSASYQLDSQLKTFWGDQIFKTLTDRIHNEYSHMTGVLERGETLTDQPEMQKSAKAIIEKVRDQDLNQYYALLESININLENDPLAPPLPTEEA